MQKVLSATGLSPEHLAKALIMQKAMLDAGASCENVASCMQKALLESGFYLGQSYQSLTSLGRLKKLIHVIVSSIHKVL